MKSLKIKRPYLYILPAFLFISLFIGYGLFRAGAESLSGSRSVFFHYISLIKSEEVYDSLKISLYVTVTSTLFSLLIGLGITRFLFRFFKSVKWKYAVRKVFILSLLQIKNFISRKKVLNLNKRTAITIIMLIVFMIPLLVFFPSIQKGIILLMEGNMQNLLTWIRSWGMFAPIVSIFLMVLQGIAAPLPSFLIAGANGMVFGVFWGIVISWIGAMAGAAVSYYLAAVFGKAIISKKYKEKHWLKKLEQFNGKHGFIIVLIARLIPIVSFDLISYAAGLTRMRISHFLLGTGIGMLPAKQG